MRPHGLGAGPSGSLGPAGGRHARPLKARRMQGMVRKGSTVRVRQMWATSLCVRSARGSVAGPPRCALVEFDLPPGRACRPSREGRIRTLGGRNRTSRFSRPDPEARDPTADGLSESSGTTMGAKQLSAIRFVVVASAAGCEPAWLGGGWLMGSGLTGYAARPATGSGSGSARFSVRSTPWCHSAMPRARSSVPIAGSQRCVMV